MDEKVIFSVPDLSSCPLGMEVSSRVDLKHVVQIAGTFEQGSKAGTGPKTVELTYSTKVEVDVENLMMLVFVDFSLFASLDKDPEPVVNIDTTFMLAYSLTYIDELTDDHYSQFAKSNGIFNVWPYWREYVQNTAVRMGLPSLTMPVLSFYKPQGKPQDETGEQPAEEGETDEQPTEE